MLVLFEDKFNYNTAMGSKKQSQRKTGGRKKTTGQRRKPAPKRSLARNIIHYGIAAGLWGFAAFVLLVTWFGVGLPRLEDVKPVKTTVGITVLADDGSLLARYGGMQGKSVDIMAVPPHVLHAVMAIEDRRFYDHFGIDLRGLARAMWANVQARRFVQGGSTLTQQLAKNLFLTPDKTIRRKIQEMILAVMIEYRFTKDEIFEAYLNRVYFGTGAYGLEAAAQAYFNKPANKLSLWEGAVLAGLLKAPSRYAPSVNPGLALKRTQTVVHAMHNAGFLSKERRDSILKSHPDIMISGAQAGDSVRYFTDWVVNNIDNYITGMRTDITVQTTLHTQLQAQAEKSYHAFFEGKEIDSKPQAALVTQAQDGRVLCMIGGRHYQDSQFNRAVQAQRQPGSAFKPFVFLAALETGFAPYNKILDARFTTGKYRPENYNAKYFGSVTLTTALAKSLNTATIRLLQNSGLNRFMSVVQRSGIESPIGAQLSSGLGASEVNLLELTNAYAIFANGGRSIKPYGITKITDDAGHVLYRRSVPASTQVYAVRDIADLNRMLTHVVTSGTGRAAQIPRIGVAGKTGTSQDYRDAWFIGYTDRLVTGIWFGQDDNTPLPRITGGRWPAQLWHDYMAAAHNMSVQHQSHIAPRAPQGNFSNLLQSLSQGTGQFRPDNRPAYRR